MISKELVSEVLRKDILLIDIQQTIITWIAIDSAGTINIYELAHKCKAWAWDNGFEIYRGYDSISIIRKSDESLVHEMYADGLDPKYDIQACQWVLDNKDSQ